MSLKRKRSESVSSPFSSSSSVALSSRDQSSSPPMDARMQQGYRDSPDLHSRTMKRHRDNRPDEGIIHENTYRRLFAAARSPPPLHQPLPTPMPRSRQDSSQRQSSLHTFWTITSSAPSTAPETPAADATTLSCQDCDNVFSVTDTDVCMSGMDDGNLETHEWGCRECRRTVCDNCAVVETGIGRECLQCRTSVRKRWVGGIGWMS